MNALLNRPKKAVKNFRAQHGPMENWSGEDFDLFYDLLVFANTPGQVARLRLRLTRSTIEAACKRADGDALIERIGWVFDLVLNVANSVGRNAARLVRG